MKRRLFIHTLIIVALLSLGVPAQAGGMATVHLDNPPEEVIVGVPWSFGFMVMQHDVTPVNVDRTYVFAQHRETGETIETEGRKEGVVGHYVAELTFPRAGSWKWSITPEPFAGTSFESIVVLDKAGAGSKSSDAASVVHPVHIHEGTCDQLGEVLYPLSDIGPGAATKDGEDIATTGTIGPSDAEGVSISETTIDITVAELLAAPHAINIHTSADEITSYVGCGDISGQMWNGDLIIGLQQLNNSGDVGIAVLSEEAERTTVTLYMLTVDDDGATAESGPTAHVEITGGEGGWAFTPSRLEIEVGTTVVWTNNTETSHTVTGKDLAFEDSGPFGQGETYSQTFTEPGTYSYFCSPHPFMTGTIVVT
jgi:plastocyanin